VTRLSRPLPAREIELQVGRALEHRSGLGDAANISLTFDRDVRDIQLEASNTGTLQPASTATTPAAAASISASKSATRPAPRQRHCASPHRDRNRGSRGADADVERSEVLKSSDVIASAVREPRSQRRRSSASRGRNADAQQLRAARR